MMSDIVERLKEEIASGCECAICELCRASLAEINTLRERVNELEYENVELRMHRTVLRTIGKTLELHANYVARAMEVK